MILWFTIFVIIKIIHKQKIHKQINIYFTKILCFTFQKSFASSKLHFLFISSHLVRSLTVFSVIFWISSSPPLACRRSACKTVSRFVLCKLLDSWQFYIFEFLCLYWDVFISARCFSDMLPLCRLSNFSFHICVTGHCGNPEFYASSGSSQMDADLRRSYVAGHKHVRDYVILFYCVRNRNSWHERNNVRL